MYKQDLALNILQGLIYCKTQLSNQPKNLQDESERSSEIIWKKKRNWKKERKKLFPTKSR